MSASARRNISIVRACLAADALLVSLAWVLVILVRLRCCELEVPLVDLIAVVAVQSPRSNPVSTPPSQPRPMMKSPSSKQR